MFPLGRFFERNITLKMGQAPVVHYMPKLFDMIANGQFDPTDMILSPIDCHLGKQQMVTISLPIEKITASRLY